MWTLTLHVAASAREQRSAARAGLRLLLGSYLGIDPQAVGILQGAFGRPELAPAHDPHDLCFNLSHTAGLAVFAVGRARSIGIDVEAVDRRAPSAGVIERALNDREAERVLRTDGPRAHRRVPALLDRQGGVREGARRGSGARPAAGRCRGPCRPAPPSVAPCGPAPPPARRTRGVAGPAPAPAAGLRRGRRGRRRAVADASARAAGDRKRGQPTGIQPAAPPSKLTRHARRRHRAHRPRAGARRVGPRAARGRRGRGRASSAGWRRR